MAGTGEKGQGAKLQELRSENDDLRAANSALSERVLELYTLYNISRTLSMSLQLNELFDLTMNAIGDSMGLGQYCLMLMDDDAEALVIQASHGMPDSVDGHGAVCSKDGISWKVAEKGEPVLVDDISKEENFLYYRDSEIRHGSFLGVPLKRKSGKVIGVLSAHKDGPHGFGEPDLKLFNAVAEHVAVAIDNALTFQHTRELMHRDELTGLYNRRYFFERFDKEVYRAKRYKHPISLLMVDIDHFKNYNDTYGHLMGDNALRILAGILDESVRKADVVCRYGGEEFLVLLPETDKKGARKVAEKLRQRIEVTDFMADEKDMDPASLTVTIGVSSLPTDTEDEQRLIDLADKALYYGKAKGRNMVCDEVPGDKAP